MRERAQLERSYWELRDCHGSKVLYENGMRVVPRALTKDVLGEVVNERSSLENYGLSDDMDLYIHPLQADKYVEYDAWGSSASQ